MRFEINLASQPYEDARRFYLAWAGILTAVLLLTVGLVSLAVVNWRSSRDMAQKIAFMRSRIAQLDQTKAQAQAVMDRPENRDIRDKSKFLNSLIERKAFSWTKVFSDLEKIMPPKLQVASIHPELKDDQLSLELSVTGESREAALELVKRMEQSAVFHNAQVQSEAVESGKNAVTFQIEAQYVPQVGPAQNPQQTTEASKGGQP